MVLSLKAGDIIHIFFEKTNPPKDKFIIILGEYEGQLQYLSVLINSKININVHRTEFQQSMYYKITKEEYPFLCYDSYINLNDPMEVEKTKVDWVVKNRSEAYKGSLSEKHLEDCRKLIHSNRIIPGKKCKNFGFFK